ncbi:winged helix-turn-helix domain-containing protein [Bacillus massiliigorillae]
MKRSCVELLIVVVFKHLRSKINECSKYPFIETVRGKGYRFNP